MTTVSNLTRSFNAWQLAKVIMYHTEHKERLSVDKFDKYIAETTTLTLDGFTFTDFNDIVTLKSLNEHNPVKYCFLSYESIDCYKFYPELLEIVEKTVTLDSLLSYAMSCLHEVEDESGNTVAYWKDYKLVRGEIILVYTDYDVEHDISIVDSKGNAIEFLFDFAKALNAENGYVSKSMHSLKRFARIYGFTDRKFELLVNYCTNSSNLNLRILEFFNRHNLVTTTDPNGVTNFSFQHIGIYGEVQTYFPFDMRTKLLFIKYTSLWMYNNINSKR